MNMSQTSALTQHAYPLIQVLLNIDYNEINLYCSVQMARLGVECPLLHLTKTISNIK